MQCAAAAARRQASQAGRPHQCCALRLCSVHANAVLKAGRPRECGHIPPPRSAPTTQRVHFLMKQCLVPRQQQHRLRGGKGAESDCTPSIHLGVELTLHAAQEDGSTLQDAILACTEASCRH